MEGRARADLGFGGEDEAAPSTTTGLAGFDPAEWSPAARSGPAPRPVAEATRAAAARAGFPSREGPVAAPPPAPAAPPRRRRTGRNAQLNLKLRPESIAAFCAIADENDWGLGETFERALALLQADEAARRRED